MKRFLEHRCCHETWDTFPRRRACKAGEEPDSKRHQFTDQEVAERGPGLPVGWPCVSGQRWGLSCSGYAPHTEAEIQGHEDDVAEINAALEAGTCTFGAPFARSGSHFTCSVDCETIVWVRM